jgi:two-component system, NarL family, response regulator NreC
MGKILIVDDHSIMRKGIKQVLFDMGLTDTIFEAENGFSAVQISMDEKPDLIIMDVGLKTEDGIEIAGQILDKLPETKIIVLTIHSTIDFIQRAMDTGIKGYVLKDSMYEELMIAINKVRRGKTYLCENSFKVFSHYKNFISATIFGKLTSHEKEILQQIAQGNSIKSIAFKYGLSEKTISSHKSHIMQKLGIKNMSELVLFASQKGLI